MKSKLAIISALLLTTFGFSGVAEAKDNLFENVEQQNHQEIILAIKTRSGNKYPKPSSSTTRPTSSSTNNSASSTSRPQVVIDSKKHPQSAKHIQDAQKNGHPTTLTIDRAGAKQNRRQSLKGHSTVPGKDRDEYPPAVFKEGGAGASVKPINSGDNRGAGSRIGHQLKGLSNGTKVDFKTK